MVIDFLRRHLVFIGLFAMGAAIFFIYPKVEKTETETEARMQEDLFPALGDGQVANNEGSANGEQVEEIILVDIKGAVKKPGVYHMDHTERVQDVVDRAGGFTKNADQTMINLAQKITDEMVIFVPIEGEELGEALPALVTGVSMNPSQSPSQAEEGKVHLNSASQEEIETLNGIGPKKAEAIINYREENGPLQSVEQLTEISGIGDKTVENIRDQIIVP